MYRRGVPNGYPVGDRLAFSGTVISTQTSDKSSGGEDALLGAAARCCADENFPKPAQSGRPRPCRRAETSRSTPGLNLARCSSAGSIRRGTREICSISCSDLTYEWSQRACTESARLWRLSLHQRAPDGFAERVIRGVIKIGFLGRS